VFYISNTLESPMPTWDDRQPIYRQLADRLAGALLDGEPPEGEPMPSVRALAAQYMLNPLTVGRALQALADDGLLDNRRGLGLFVRSGARERLLALERQRFLEQEWPALRTKLRRLGLQMDELTWEA
jgi:GntR family transcriptional regulator